MIIDPVTGEEVVLVPIVKRPTVPSKSLTKDECMVTPGTYTSPSAPNTWFFSTGRKEYFVCFPVSRGMTLNTRIVGPVEFAKAKFYLRYPPNFHESKKGIA